MATTDVSGYVIREQGCTKLTVLDGGEVELQSGAKMDVQSGSTCDLGGTMVFTSDAIIAVEWNVSTHASTADGRISNYGHSMIKPTSSGIHFRMNAPVKGREKYITAYSSIPCWVHATTASGQTSPRIGELSTNAVTVINLHGTPAQGCAGVTVHLRGASTVKWYLMSYPSTVLCQFSTST